MARRLIADVQAGDHVRWRDVVGRVEHVDHVSSMALVSYRKPGYPLRHALVHLAELEFERRTE
jgi:hypothetical protein